MAPPGAVLSVGRVAWLVIVSALIVTATHLLFGASSGIRAIDEMLNAWRFPSGDRVSEDIVLVEIGSETVRVLGELPWDRAVYARVLERLARLPGTVVGMSLLLDEPRSEPGDSALAAVAAAHRNIVFGRPHVPRHARAPLFYDALAQAQPVNGILSFDDARWPSSIGIAALDTHFLDPDRPSGETAAFPVKAVEVFLRSRARRPASEGDEPNQFEFLRRHGLRWSISHPIRLELWSLTYPINYVGDASAFARVPYERLAAGSDVSWMAGKIVLVTVNPPLDSMFTPLSATHAGRRSSRGLVWANAINGLLTGQHVLVPHPVLTHLLLLAFAMILMAAAIRTRTAVSELGLGLLGILVIVVAREVLWHTLRLQVVLMPYVLVWAVIEVVFQIRRYLRGRRLALRVQLVSDADRRP